MRPYLAIIRDSFHEALASRVLWILIVLSSLFLLALAPLGVTERVGSVLEFNSLTDVRALATQLKAQGAYASPSPGRRIFELASDDLKSKLAKPPAKDSSWADDWTLGNELVVELNAMLKRPDFFNKDDWKSNRLGKEARGLLDEGLDKLTPERLARFNRLALEAAFPREIAPSGNQQMQFSYLIWDVGDPLAIGRKELVSTIGRTLMVFMGLVLGVGGIMTAILVTASIIPHTFEAGAIDLLLSKPVSRPLVFLTKFVGGCAFILLIAVWTIGGIWLILGVRFGVWSPRLLLCIPLYMFLFAIYYAVSGLAGLIWKNAIVSIVLTIMFWFTCWSMGTAKQTFEAFVVMPQRLVKIVPAGDALLAVNESGKVLRWNEAGSTWDEVFRGTNDGTRQFAFGLIGGMVGPVYDAKEQRLLALDRPLRQFGPMARGTPLLIGRPRQDWRRITGPAAPTGTEALLVDAGGTPLAVAPRAVFRLEGNAEAKVQPVKLWGFELPMESVGPKFVEASPGLGLSTPLSAAFNTLKSEIAIFDGRRLVVLAPADNGQFRVRVEIEIKAQSAGIVAYAGATLVLALADGRVQVFDPTNLKLKRTITLEKSSAPRVVAVSPDGRWVAAVFHDGRLWLYDAVQDSVRELSAAGWHDASAVALAGPNLLLVADDVNRVSDYDLRTGQIVKRRHPALSTWEAIYYYAIKPLYTVFPKPGELDNMMHYLLTDETSVPISGMKNDLSSTRVKIDVWGPVWSNLAFLSIVLAIGCVYVSRKDF